MRSKIKQSHPLCTHITDYITHNFIFAHNSCMSQMCTSRAVMVSMFSEFLLLPESKAQVISICMDELDALIRSQFISSVISFLKHVKQFKNR